MANALLRLNKDAVTTKLSLALFTATMADNEVLGARVAHLETEFAGVALAHGRKDEALHALVAAAAAHRVLNQGVLALSCLHRAAILGAADAETMELLRTAIADLTKQLKPAPAPKPVPTPKALPKPTPAPKIAPKAAPKVEQPKAEEAKRAPKKAPNKGRGASGL